MQHLEVSAAVRHIYMSLGFKGFKTFWTQWRPFGHLRIASRLFNLLKTNVICFI